MTCSSLGTRTSKQRGRLQSEGSEVLAVRCFLSGALVGIHPSKAHYHVLKHSICVLLWQETRDLNAIQDHVGRSSSSTLVYLRADAAQKAQTIIAGMSFGGAL